MRSKTLPLIVLCVGAIAGIGTVSLLRDTKPSPANESDQAPPVTDHDSLQEHGPLDGGPRISLDEAKTRSDYRLAIPPTNELTGVRTGIWMDGSGQAAFLWETDLRMYVSDPAEFGSQQDAEDHWDNAVKANADEGIRRIEVEGVSGIGYDGTGKRPSFANIYMNGVSISFVSPNHTLEELLEIANEISFE